MVPSNLHLVTGSPAINAGALLEPAMGGNLDIDGEPRIIGAKADIGADETGVMAGLRRRPKQLGPKQPSTAIRNWLGRTF